MPGARWLPIGADYFKVLRVPVVRGRAFTAEDGWNKPGTVIIDESLAKKFFPGQDPIGKQLDNNQTLKENPPPLTIVGIVPRTRNEAPGEDNVEKLGFAQIHLPLLQFPNDDVRLLVRVASGDALALAPAVKREMDGVISAEST